MPIKKEVELKAADSVCGALESLLTPHDNLDITVSVVTMGTLNQTAYQFYMYARDRDGRINRDTFRMAWVTAHPMTRQTQVWLANFNECIIDNPLAANLGAMPRMTCDPHAELGVAAQYQYPVEQSVKAAGAIFTFFNTGKRPAIKEPTQSPFRLPPGVPKHLKAVA